VLSDQDKHDRCRPFLIAKRFVDIVVSASGLVISAPLQVCIALTVLVSMGRPVLFLQRRPGKSGKVFYLIKFRTMLQPNPERGLITNEQRMTTVGSILRSLSVDELPSLWNVFKGDMSLVGPRPLREAYLPRYSKHHAKRHLVRPGVTGLAQVSGRNNLSWDQRLDLDVHYVENMSLALDMSILLRTVRAVFVREGISGEGQATMGEFLGSGEELETRRLSHSDLSERVRWLRHPDVRAGITIKFWPELKTTVDWFEHANNLVTRRDYVCTVRSNKDKRVSMFGFTNMIGDSAEFYIYVNPDFLGFGYGNRTMVQALKTAEQIGLSHVRLETKKSNMAALNLYLRYGFRVSESIENDTKYVMMIDLVRGGMK
jgi:lipopolysaccharide/colanic/teichoic acid biosynthesis glycosyltransferase/ribosomal protein S18 acetylase RimI-like enzyme